MKRLHEKKIDDANYYDTLIWAEETNLRPYYDAVRQRALIQFVKDGDDVVDIGAGVFGACQYISEETEIKANLYAYDQSNIAKKIVTEKCPEITYIVGEVEPTVDIESNRFDCVIAGEIIEHMEDPSVFVKELARICKPGGIITLSTVDTTSENAIKHGDYPEHLWSFDPEDLVGFFSPYGDTEFSTVGDYQFIVCKKYENS